VKNLSARYDQVTITETQAPTHNLPAAAASQTSAGTHNSLN
jgi:hypothetical protein